MHWEFKVDIIAAAEAEDHSGQLLTIDIVGQDRPGIVREVSSVLAGIDVNIEDFASKIEGSAWSGAPLFRAKVQMMLPAGLSTDKVREALEAISSEVMVDFDREPASS